MKILVVDTSNDIRETLLGVLGSAGYICIGEKSPRQALKLYKTGDFDAVIMDVMMAQMDGVAFLKEIQAFNPNAVVIAMTSHGDAKVYQAVMENRAYAFFHKSSMNMQHLLDCLKKIDK